MRHTLAMLVRVMEQALRDGIIDRNPARITGWQKQYARVEDELDDPRSLALPDWATLQRLADTLAARSAGQYGGGATSSCSPRARPRASGKCPESG
ncbi:MULTISPECIES: hypothetical protein [unclassified Saccharothrix]|uniref:hypothetical protein n=1 Tax=unclassified Saccharothrix TaxID=2593673 RepID=UPI00307F2C1D